MVCVEEPKSEKRFALLALITFTVSFLLFLYTLAPSVSTIFDDSLEFQVVCHQLGIAHPTGYPLYTLLGKLFTYLPFGDVAYRVNLLSAVCGALTTALVGLIVARASDRRLAGFAAGVALAISPVFWSQSTIAEVYTLNSLFITLMVYCALVWQEEEKHKKVATERASRWYWLMLLSFGLSLTHHRTAIFMALPLLVFILVVNRRVLLNYRNFLGLLACLLLPQTLYLYLPLRGMVTSSLDGSYKNTVADFLRYISASGYNVFLTQNPLGQDRTFKDYVQLFYQQFHPIGLFLGGIGFFYMLRKARAVWALATVAFATYTFFALSYRVADVEVFFIPSFVFLAIWLGFGLAFLMDLVARLVLLLGSRPTAEQVAIAPGSEPRDVWRPPPELIGNGVAIIVVPLLFFAVMRPIAVLNYPYNDRSRDWAVYDYGKDMLEQPLEKGAVIIGLQGEITLLRYFQTAENLRPDVVTIAADDEEVRRVAVAENLERGHAVYLTRPLSGISGLYTFSALGPLTRVQKRPGAVDITPDYAADVYFGDSIHLLGYDLAVLQHHWRDFVRLTLFWEVTGPIEESYKVSARLYNQNGDLVGQTDSFPVHDTYPTTAWQLGEVVRDVYDIPIVPGTPPGLCKLHVVVYNPQNGQEVAHAELKSLNLRGASSEPPVGELSVDHVVRVEVLDGLQLLGYSLLDRDMLFKQGEEIPLNFLWRFNNGLAKDGAIRIWLDKTDASLVQAIPQWVDLVDVPPAPRPTGPILLRQWVKFPVTARVPDGTYDIYLAAYASEAEAQATKKPGIFLGRCIVKGRERSFEVPQMETQVGAILDRKVTLLGFDLNGRTHKPGDELKVKIYWQAKTEMDVSYKVFIHLVGPNGTIRAQQDVMPHNGEWPTTGWVQGEVIADEYHLPIAEDTPPGTYRLIAGMYRADTGQRLTATAGNNNPLGDSVPLTEVAITK